MDGNGFKNSPNHPIKSGGPAPDNVIKLPGMMVRKARLFKNNMMDAVLGPEQVYSDAPEPEPETRPEHFEVGQQEGTLHSLHEQRIKRNMRAGDESVMRMINMDDPTKD